MYYGGAPTEGGGFGYPTPRPKSMYAVFIQKIVHMKQNLQQYYRYDSTILGLDGIYIPLPNNSFYIDAPCIQPKKIWIGKTYYIRWILPDMQSEIQIVKLVDMYCDNVRMNLDVEDVPTHKIFTINFDFRVKQQCQWELIDLTQTSDDDLFEIEEFCGC